MGLEEYQKERIGSVASSLFEISGPRPGMFDLVLAILVFTHLNEDHQFHWVRELERVTRKKGTLVLTIHGYHCWKELRSEDIEKVEAQGFFFLKSNFWKGVFPEWYQTAYHTGEYVLENYGTYFEVLD